MAECRALEQLLKARGVVSVAKKAIRRRPLRKLPHPSAIRNTLMGTLGSSFHVFNDEIDINPLSLVSMLRYFQPSQGEAEFHEAVDSR